MCSLFMHTTAKPHSTQWCNDTGLFSVKWKFHRRIQASLCGEKSSMATWVWEGGLGTRLESSAGCMSYHWARGMCDRIFQRQCGTCMYM